MMEDERARRGEASIECIRTETEHTVQSGSEQCKDTKTQDDVRAQDDGGVL